jgi:hypothetical protein
MEKTMFKTLGVSTALLSLALLISAGAVSSQTRGTIVRTSGAANQNSAVLSGVNESQMLTSMGSAIYDGGNGNQYNNDQNKDKDKDKDKDKNPHGPTPTPEPSTFLSFGAAILIGFGVLYSRRLRRKQN